ncbi:MAG: hypothetical protein ACRDQJ_16030, partial [Pseudonocardiaceae bacterium]
RARPISLQEPDTQAHDNRASMFGPSAHSLTRRGQRVRDRLRVVYSARRSVLTRGWRSGLCQVFPGRASILYCTPVGAPRRQTVSGPDPPWWPLVFLF